MQKVINRTLYTDQTYPYYVFTSDIHGNANTLPLIKQALSDFPSAQLVGGGDYIDGRKNSKQVCDYLMVQAEHGAVILNGNHEELMLNFANGRDLGESGIPPLWYVNGGKTTMRSFLGRGYSKPKTADMLKQTKYYDFFSNRNYMYVTPAIIFVHGGVKPVANFDDPNIYHENGLDTGLKDYDFYRLWSRENYWYHEILAPNQHDYPQDHRQKFSVRHDHIYLKNFAHNKTGHVIVTGHTPTTFLTGFFDDGRYLPPVAQSRCSVRVVKYQDEPARIFTDGGCHSRLPHNYGNVIVLDDHGRIICVYDYRHQTGISWTEYRKEKKK